MNGQPFLDSSICFVSYFFELFFLYNTWKAGAIKLVFVLMFYWHSLYNIMIIHHYP